MVFDQSKKRLFFLLIIVVFCCFNLSNRLVFLSRVFPLIKKEQAPVIGGEFVPLAPYLEHVRFSGYMTCLDSPDPLTDVRIMGPYQQSQFALTGTFIDYFHPLDYSYLVLDCPDRSKVGPFIRKLSAYKVLKFFNGVLLLDRKKLDQ